MSSHRHGPPKHQNRYAWKPNAGQKINETEVGGKQRPLSEITGVCPRCKDQIDWKRRYGKYKPLSEPAKCQRCSKRAVRQAYHNLCPGCAKVQNVCAKCCSHVDRIIGRDLSEAIKKARERDRRTLLHAMDKGKSNNPAKNPAYKNKVRELFPCASHEEYVANSRGGKDDNNDDDSRNDTDKSNDEDEEVDDEAGDNGVDGYDNDNAEDAD